MQFYSTREAAKRVGIPYTTLATYVAAGKVPRPKTKVSGRATAQIWTEEELENIRILLPKIANGRKTRYQKLREKQRTQPKAAALPKKRRTKKKK